MLAGQTEDRCLEMEVAKPRVKTGAGPLTEQGAGKVWGNRSFLGKKYGVSATMASSKGPGRRTRAFSPAPTEAEDRAMTRAAPLPPPGTSTCSLGLPHRGQVGLPM